MKKKRMYGVKVLRQTCVDGKVVEPGTYLIAADIKQVNAVKLIEANKATEIPFPKKPEPEPVVEPEVAEKESPEVAEVKNREDAAPPVARRGRPGRPRTTRKAKK